jgi:amino acid transporter
MANYTSLILGALTCGAAFAWMMFRIKRSEKRREERRKAAEAKAVIGIGVSSTAQYTETRELAHTR